jgi:SRSO17 transposase
MVQRQKDITAQTVDHHLTAAWTTELDAVETWHAPHAGRADLRDPVRTSVRWLLAGSERKNGWQLAEAAGHATPYGLQHLLGRARWDADAVRDALRDDVVAQLGDEAGVLMVDEPSFLTKGTKSVGVKRQHSGTAERIENCQAGVFLAYAAARGQAVVDWELNFPAEWADDDIRRAEAGVPETVSFATMPELAERMLARPLDAGVEAAWVVADAVSGDSRRLGMMLEARAQPYVPALSGTAHVLASVQQLRVGDGLAALRDAPGDGWQRLSAGNGAKGPQCFDWCRFPLTPPLQDGFERWLLVRRGIDEPDALTAFTAFAPAGTTIEELVRVGAAAATWRWALRRRKAR